MFYQRCQKNIQVKKFDQFCCWLFRNFARIYGTVWLISVQESRGNFPLLFWRKSPSGCDRCRCHSTKFQRCHPPTRMASSKAGLSRRDQEFQLFWDPFRCCCLLPPTFRGDSIQVETMMKLEGLKAFSFRLPICSSWQLLLKMNIPRHNRGNSNNNAPYLMSGPS